MIGRKEEILICDWSVSGHVLCAYCGCPPAKHEKVKVDRKRGRSEDGDGLECEDDIDRMSDR